MSINPEDFIKATSERPAEIGSDTIFGTFMCKDCNENIRQAKFNEDELLIVYVCSSNHRNEVQL
jgi:hypothetical protein